MTIGEITRTWRYLGRFATLRDILNRTVGEIHNATLGDLINPTKGTIYLNLQQDLNELDRKSTGEVDYSIYKGRTTQNYNVQKGDGVSLTDISASSEFVPEYRILDINKIGNTYVYRMEKYNGQD